MLTRLLTAAMVFGACIQGAYAMSIDEQIDKYFAPFSNIFSKIVFTSVTIAEAKVPLLILLLIAASFICTFYLRGICIWGVKHSIKQIFGKKTEIQLAELR